MTDENEHITLDELIHSYVSAALQTDNAADDTVGLKRQEISRVQKQAETDMRNKIRDDILRELTDIEKEKMIRQARKALDKEKIRQIASLLGEGGLLALFIGVLVNQVSNFLTDTVCPQGYSWKIIGILLLAVFGVFGFLLYQSISRMFNLGEENEPK